MLDLSKSERSGLTIAVITLFTYSPMVGIMTSHSIVRQNVQSDFNMSMTLSTFINSLAIGFTVGFSPVSSWLFSRYRHKLIVLLGYGLGSFALLVCGYLSHLVSSPTDVQDSAQTGRWTNTAPAQNLTETQTGVPNEGGGGYSLVIVYSILYGVANNFVYNGAMCMTGTTLKKSKYLATATVILSLAVPLGTFISNIFSQSLLTHFGDQHVVKYRYGIYAGLLGLSMLIFGCFVSDQACDKTSSERPMTPENEKLQRTNSDSDEFEETVETKVHLGVLRDGKVLIWIIATALWGMLFTIPNTLGSDYMTREFNMTSEEASKVLASTGVVELITRLMIATFGTLLPTSRGTYSGIYSLCCFFVGASCLLVTTQSSNLAAWAYFLLIQPPVAIMNCLIYAATENIFTSKWTQSVWPFTNLCLAIGFTSGPIMCTLILKVADFHQGVLVAGVLSTLGGGLLAVLYTKSKRLEQEDM